MPTTQTNVARSRVTKQKPEVYPKPRYPIPECLYLLDLSESAFYKRVRAGIFEILKDGRRTYMTHDQLTEAAGSGLHGSTPR